MAHSAAQLKIWNSIKMRLNAHPLFGDIDYKESHNVEDHFPRLRIVVKNEIVYLGLDRKLFEPIEPANI